MNTYIENKDADGNSIYHNDKNKLHSEIDSEAENTGSNSSSDIDVTVFLKNDTRQSLGSNDVSEVTYTVYNKGFSLNDFFSSIALRSHQIQLGLMYIAIAYLDYSMDFLPKRFSITRSIPKLIKSKRRK